MTDGPKDRKFSRRLPAYRTAAQKTRMVKPPPESAAAVSGPGAEARPPIAAQGEASPSTGTESRNAPSLLRRSNPLARTILNPFLQQTAHTQLQIMPEHALFALLLTIVLFVRLASLDFNTLHLDEAVNLAIGKATLAGAAIGEAAPFIAGSHLYPILTALLERIGGIVGLRALSAALMTIATGFIYLTANRVFSSRAALWAAFFFGLAGVSLNLGQYAVADALALPLLTASLYCATASLFDGRRGWMLLAGITFGIGAVTSFPALLALAALLLWVLLVRRRLEGSHAAASSRAAWGYFLYPLALMLGLYAVLGYPDLQALGRYEPQSVSPDTIVQTLLRDIGAPAGLALISLPMLGAARTDSVSKQGARARVSAMIPVIGWFLAVWLFAVYHVATSDARWLWQHEVYALVFLALLAGYGLDQLVQRSRATALRMSLPMRTLGAGGMLILLFGSGAGALIQNADWQRAWPDIRKVLDRLEQEQSVHSARVWSPVGVIYSHYLEVALDDPLSRSQPDTAALRRLIANCAFDFLILDDFYLREPWDQVEAVMKEGGYSARYAFSEALSGQVTVTTRVYAPTIPCRFF